MAATGIISEATRLAAELVAACTSWQTWTETADETEALSRVHEISLRGSQRAWPFAVVGPPKKQVGRGGFGPGQITVIFEDLVPEEYQRGELDDGEIDNSAGSEEFRNNVGAVINEMMDVQEEGGRLFVRTIDLADNVIRRSEHTDKYDYFQLVATINYGATTR